MLADTCYGDAWADHVKTLQPNATVVFFGGAFLHGITVKGRWRVACAQAWDDKFETTVQRRLADLRAPNHDVYVATLPYPLGPYDSEPYRKQTDCINASLRKAAAANDGVKVLELGARLCPSAECDLDFGGKTIRPDGVHFDIDGARELSNGSSTRSIPRSTRARSTTTADKREDHDHETRHCFILFGSALPRMWRLRSRAGGVPHRATRAVGELYDSGAARHRGVVGADRALRRSRSQPRRAGVHARDGRRRLATRIRTSANPRLTEELKARVAKKIGLPLLTLANGRGDGRRRARTPAHRRGGALGLDGKGAHGSRARRHERESAGFCR